MLQNKRFTIVHSTNSLRIVIHTQQNNLIENCYEQIKNQEISHYLNYANLECLIIKFFSIYYFYWI